MTAVVALTPYQLRETGGAPAWLKGTGSNLAISISSVAGDLKKLLTDLERARQFGAGDPAQPSACRRVAARPRRRAAEVKQLRRRTLQYARSPNISDV
ncbi:MAG: hypothetical protein H0W53_20355 [Acidobacteria bacterium]|nr:hypothetical protein [Acidobacteriota bacterium]